MYQVNKWLVVNILLDHNFLRFVLNAYLNFYSSQNKWKWKQVVCWWEQVSLPVLHWAVPYKFPWKSQNFWGVGVVKCKNLKARHKAKMNLSGLGVWIFWNSTKQCNLNSILSTKFYWSPQFPSCVFYMPDTLPSILYQNDIPMSSPLHSFVPCRAQEQQFSIVLSHCAIWHSNVTTTRSISLWHASATMLL